jgi:hypothetical protein
MLGQNTTNCLIQCILLKLIQATGLPKVMSGEMEREEYYENEVVTKSGKLIYWNNVNQRRYNKELLCSGIDILNESIRKLLIKVKDEFHLCNQCHKLYG